MVGTNILFPMSIQTQRGIVDIANIVPGDLVYEYGTGRMLSVQCIHQTPVDDIYDVRYSDGRVMFIPRGEYIYTGLVLKRIEDLEFEFNSGFSKYKSLDNIRMYPIDFHPDRVLPELKPDPYIAGALLICGDYEQDYINLPMTNFSPISELMNKYHLQYAELPSNNKVTFRKSGRTARVTWSEFFNDEYCYVVTKSYSSPIIPAKYMRASLKNRVQFIRGVFDTGYDKSISPDKTRIHSNRPGKLFAVQQMLWSLGVSSVVLDPDDTPISNGRNYYLEVVGFYDGYPGLFYELDAITHHIENDYELINLTPKFETRIASVSKKSSGYTYNLVLENHHMRYLTHDFLPRVSL